MLVRLRKLMSMFSHVGMVRAAVLSETRIDESYSIFLPYFLQDCMGSTSITSAVCCLLANNWGKVRREVLLVLLHRYSFPFVATIITLSVIDPGTEPKHSAVPLTEGTHA